MEKKEAMKILKEFRDKSALFSVRTALDTVIPELKESEDEKIRNLLIDIYKRAADTGGEIYAEGITYKQVIAWLEKQSKLEDNGDQDKQHLYDIIAALWDLLDKIDTFSDLQIDDTRTHNPFRKIEGIAQERHKFVKSDGYDLFIEGEKITDFKHQSEQKSNNVEPKFKVGDWCIDNEDGTIFQIVKVLDNSYMYKTNEGKEYSCSHYSLEIDAKLWTIQDANDGDVLYAKGGYFKEYIFMFSSFTEDNVISTHFGYDAFHKTFDTKLSRFGRKEDFISVTPATKEQRELLLQEMADAGYEWDAENKELKKIEQK